MIRTYRKFVEFSCPKSQPVRLTEGDIVHIKFIGGSIRPMRGYDPEENVVGKIAHIGDSLIVLDCSSLFKSAVKEIDFDTITLAEKADMGVIQGIAENWRDLL